MPSATPPDPACHFTQVWQFSRKTITGQTQVQSWSVKYHFGTEGFTEADATTIMNALYTGTASVVIDTHWLAQEMYTPPATQNATMINDYTQGAKPGALNPSNEFIQQPEVTIDFRALMGRNSLNKKYYLSKHIHGVLAAVGSDPSNPAPQLATAFSAMVTAMTGGGVGGLPGAKWTNKAGVAPVGLAVTTPVLTTRQLRRGWKTAKNPTQG
jgi:hypothetical protein